jgi:hypothetical protein
MSIFSVLYNTGKGIEEIPFEEIRVEQNDLIDVHSDISEKKLFARVANAPI